MVESYDLVMRNISFQDAVIKFLIQTQAVEWKASEWNLKIPDWSGKLKLVSICWKSVFFGLVNFIHS